jgi:hypothetical protein
MKLKNKIIVTTGLSLSALLAACSTGGMDQFNHGYEFSQTTKTYPAVPQDHVKLIYKDSPNADKAIPCTKYETISMIEVSPYMYGVANLRKDSGDIDNAFKEAGASVGADAVINIVSSQGVGNSQGYAIKCDS